VVIPRGKGVCGLALENALKTPLDEDDITIITDLRDHPRCAGAAFLDSGPQLRFYAGVPIRTVNGATIGVYCIFDDKLRPGLTADQKVFLRDMAKTTMDHLDTVRLRTEHTRIARLVAGLESFIDGLTTIRSPQEEAHNQQNPDVENAKELAMQDVAADSPRAQPKDMDNDTDTIGTVPKSLWELAMPLGSKPMLSRAANIIRQAGDYDGVAFFYLTSTNLEKGQISRRQNRKSDLPNMRTPSPPSPHAKDSSLPLHSEGSSDSLEKLFGRSDSEDSSSVERTSPTSPCPLLSYSLASEELTARPTGRAPFSSFMQRDMDRLIGKGPRARTFTLNRRGEVLPGDTSSSGSGVEQVVPIVAREEPDGELNTDASRVRRLNIQRKQIKSLQKLCPSALSYVCLPLWDSERQRWLAYCICWSTSPSRDFKEDGDLSFLRIFGNSIGIALSHIDAIASSKAKSTFVSSMSHELRSPLHGVLSATNFLNDSNLSRFQREMVNVISNCGRTLLDTVDHVMDFAKISSLATKSRKRSSGGSGLTPMQTEVETLTSTVDLSILLEEVVEVVLMGFQSQEDFFWNDEDPRASFHRLPSFNSTLNSLAQSRRVVSSQGRVRIVVQLPYRPNWCVTTQVGAWRRIIMNLFGNSLKYTSDGLIIVRIQAETEHSSILPLSLDIVDTGKGMSKQYMDTRLYTPFSQEDDFSSGTGLGLSIVHQIVQALGGTIDISSSPGVGTKIRVNLGVPAANPAPSGFDSATTIEAVAERLRGQRVYILEDASTEPSDDPTALSLQQAESEFSSSVSNTLREWFGIDVSVGTSWPTPHVDLVICLKSSVRHLDQATKNGLAPVLMITHDALEMAVLRADSRISREDAVIEIISQP
jgi:signal transduction histidine kinase